MRMTDLTRGQVFQLEGGHYETQYVSPSGRIVLAYILDAKGKRQIDPDDLTGDVCLTTAFSDLRFEREHLTPEERAQDEELKALL